MKTETHFSISNIENILFWPMKKTHYEWFEAAPEIRYFFGWFQKRPALKAGWDTYKFHKVYSDYDYYGVHEYWSPRYSSEYLENRLNLVPVLIKAGETVWYEQARVVVNKRGGKHQYGKDFKSDEEAKEWIEYLKKESKEKFEIIIHEQ